MMVKALIGILLAMFWTAVSTPVGDVELCPRPSVS
jgi:hypothetical protein